jgi:hypothetical protein
MRMYVAHLFLGTCALRMKKTGVCGGYVAYPLKQSSQFVCKAVYPHLSVFVRFDEISIFKHVTCGVVYDRADEVFRRRSVAAWCGERAPRKYSLVDRWAREWLEVASGLPLGCVP